MSGRLCLDERWECLDRWWLLRPLPPLFVFVLLRLERPLISDLRDSVSMFMFIVDKERWGGDGRSLVLSELKCGV